MSSIQIFINDEANDANTANSLWLKDHCLKQLLPLAVDKTNDTVLTIIWVGLNMTLVIVYVKKLPLQN